MSDERMSPPGAGSAAAAVRTNTLVIPPRPDLPTRPPQPGSSRISRSATFWPRVLLGAYVVVLAVIALWPVPVDGGARPLLRLVGRVIPAFTYERIEFGANILLFVPLGLLLALILARRHLIVPIAVVATVTIESMQALLIDKRTPSVLDIIANLTGACLGLLIVAAVEWRRSRRDVRETDESR